MKPATTLSDAWGELDAGLERIETDAAGQLAVTAHEARALAAAIRQETRVHNLSDETITDKAEEAADCIVDCNLDADERREYLRGFVSEVLIGAREGGRIVHTQNGDAADPTVEGSPAALEAAWERLAELHPTSLYNEPQHSAMGAALAELRRQVEAALRGGGR